MINLQIIGNLGSDATVSNVGGKNVVNFSVAHSYKIKDQHVTTWVKCAMWEKDNLAQYLKKGTKVYCSGVPSADAYMSGPQMDQKAIAQLMLTVYQIELLSSKPDQQ